MTAYYNDNDPYCAQWLRNLIVAGLIAPGDVDERSITKVKADDVRGYTQVHMFAGIGGWSYALRLAGWDDSKPAWTGSCPCQPLSVAGQRKGHVDERHLWPAFHALIAECKPPTIFGEQVASKDGREWLAAVRADLEGNGYAIGAADLCAAGAGAPHIRQRLWFVADSAIARWSPQPERTSRTHGRPPPEPGRLCDAGSLADAGASGLPVCEQQDLRGAGWRQQGRAVEQSSPAGDLADAESGGLREQRHEAQPGCGGHAHGGFWSDLEWLPCTDGKARPVKPGIQPLAHGVSARASKLRAIGNAIVPALAAEFIKAYLEC